MCIFVYVCVHVAARHAQDLVNDTVSVIGCLQQYLQIVTLHDLGADDLPRRKKIGKQRGKGRLRTDKVLVELAALCNR
jgi:hypothetical protein